MSAPSEYDLLIVGSGPSGSHAAMEAVASGRKVALVEIGYSDDQPQKFDPSKTFSEIRRTDPNQHAYFLGENPVTVLRIDRLDPGFRVAASQSIERLIRGRSNI